jgi:NAD-dependent SIR2 family protein deacetylase
MNDIQRAAELLREADGLLISAGAGMGVDSGLPDFRGNQGFWKAYPPLARAGIKFTEIANSAAFCEDPILAWGFYGHRLQLYRDTVPHEGFAILLAMAAQLTKGSFVFTSNVDGQFQKVGFDSEYLVECHGSIHHLQCMEACTNEVWSAEGFVPVIDIATCRMISDLPHCPRCGQLARPNILMFNDTDWVPNRTDAQYDRLESWLGTVKRPVAIEIGAGTHIPSVRRQSEALKAPLIRINPREPEVHRITDIGLPMDALSGMRILQSALAMGR